jgi:hypothetical protein
MSDQERNKRWSMKVWAGFGLVLLCHLIWLLLYGIGLLFLPESDSSAFLAAYLMIGVTQLVYVLPLAVYSGFKNKQLLQGILLAALVTFLLNAACFGLVLFQFAG